jgi:hypothetical protein
MDAEVLGGAAGVHPLDCLVAGIRRGAFHHAISDKIRPPAQQVVDQSGIGVASLPDCSRRCVARLVVGASTERHGLDALTVIGEGEVSD